MVQHKIFTVYPTQTVFGTISCHSPILDKLRGAFNDQNPRNEFTVVPGVTAYQFASANDTYNARATKMLKAQLEAEFPDRKDQQEIRGSVVFVMTQVVDASTAWFARMAEEEKPHGAKRPPAPKTAETLYVMDRRKQCTGVLGPNANNKFKKDFQALSPKDKEKWEALHDQQVNEYKSKRKDLASPSNKPMKAKKAHNLYDAACREKPDEDAPAWKELDKATQEKWKKKAKELAAQMERDLKAKMKSSGTSATTMPPSTPPSTTPPGGASLSEARSPKREREEPKRTLTPFEDVKPPPAKKQARKPNVVDDSSDSNSESEASEPDEED